MEEELKSIIEVLKYTSEENHNEGAKLSGVSNTLSEWYFGRSEGIECAIEMLQKLIESN